MPSLNVTCPTGLSVMLREFKVKDEDLLSDPKSIRKGIATTKLLEAITEEVVDAGPYSLKAGRNEADVGLDWGEVLQGDLMVVLLKNRIRTWGPKLISKQPCQNCQDQVEKEVDLEDEMEIQELPGPSRRHVEDGTPIEVVLPSCGKKVAFRLLRGKDERALQRIQKEKRDKRSSAYLRFRIVDVEGVKQPEWGSWLEDLSSRDSSFLRAAFDEADCGVNQTVEFECTSCGHVWEDDVRFRADFLFPRYRGKTTKTDSSES